MKKIFLILFTIFFTSCDDGDFTVEILDFDDADIKLCGDYVFYKLTNENTEALLIQITSKNEELLKTVDTVEYALNGNNKIFYRIFDGDSKDYFCNEVQPVNPKVIEEWEAVSGTIEIATVLVEDDNDGVPPEEEDRNNDGNLENDDTDGDGIPDYKDIDDDGDNIPTILEGYNSEDPTASLNSDSDNLPNYLDDDDDDDGTPTREEDEDGDKDPTNDIENGFENPSYLEPTVSTSYSDPGNRTHIIQLNYINTIRIINGFQLQGDSQEIKYSVSGFDYGTYEVKDTETHDFN